MKTDVRLLKLSNEDNCAIARNTISGNEPFFLNGNTYTADEEIPIGFKIALTDIEPEEKIIKWGMSIGSATEKIPIGSLIHTHNMKSDYIPTIMREQQLQYFESQT